MELSERQNLYDFEGFRLIPAEGLLLKDGEPVSLSPKVFKTLVLLVERRGHLVSKSELMDRVWADSFVEENAVSKSVWAIRNALGEVARSQQFIQTVPKHGYRFIAEVQEKYLDANGMISTSAIGDVGANEQVNSNFDPSPIRSIKGRYRFVVGLLVVAVLAFSAIAFRNWVTGSVESSSIRSLTVLPLENVSGDVAQQYFVDGMTDALIGDLARIHELKVIARSRKDQTRDTPSDISQIGRDLNVDSVLIGTVNRSGDRVRISVQLIHAMTGQHIWADTYERPLSDILLLQKEVARRIADEIRIKLSPQEVRQLEAGGTVNPEAYDSYQRGRYFLNLQNKGDQDLAIAALERAVAIDPTFAAAYAELAQAYTWKHFSFAPDDKELAEKAYVASEKALSMDPELAVGYLARGRILWTPGNNFPHEKVIAVYRKALELNPNLDEARNQLALVYSHIGALDEALEQAREGVRINPTNNLFQLRIGQSLNSYARYDEALAVFRGTPKKVHPSMIGHQTAWAMYNLGMAREASALLDELLVEHEDLGGTFASMQAVIAASSGEKEKAKRFIAQAFEKGKGYGHFHHTAYTISCAYALMNERDEAIKWVQVAAETGYPCFPSFLNDKNLDNLRQDPRFISFLETQRQQWENRRNEL